MIHSVLIDSNMLFILVTTWFKGFILRKNTIDQMFVNKGAKKPEITETSDYNEKSFLLVFLLSAIRQRFSFLPP